MVKDGEVVIVDEFTGRLMPGRRWSDGLHQAVEAKEKVKIERENQTLATVTFQNYFRKYKKLSGMTGTADTEAEEFAKIYKLDVIVMPTNRPLRRVEQPDLVYRTEREKWDAIVTDIIDEAREGTAGAGRHGLDREVREALELLDRRGLKRGTPPAAAPTSTSCSTRSITRRKPSIVAQAGRKGAVTIATNMAGRGTDILLGGNAEFMARQQASPRRSPSGCRRARSASSTTRSSSTSTISTASIACREADYERIFAHFKRRSRRRARGGRRRSAACTSSAPSATRRAASTTSCAAAPAARAIPGSSRFYLSLEDDLMRIFGSDRISGLMQRLGMEEGVPIEHGMVTKRDRARAEAGRGAELRRPQAPARVRRRDEQAAREHLRAAPARSSRARSGSTRTRKSRHARVPDDARRGHARRRGRDLRAGARRTSSSGISTR